MYLTIADLPDIQNIPGKKVHLGDIDVEYKMLGKGDSILLISGASAGINYSKLRHVKTPTEGL